MIYLFLIIVFLYIGLYIYSLVYKNNSLVDLLWGIIPAMIAAYMLFDSEILSLSEGLLYVLVIAWGIRLFLNILSKKWGNIHTEDIRYARWRSSWKYVKTRSFLQVYLLQMILVIVVSLPIFIIAVGEFDQNKFTALFGALIALLGLLYESRADAELAGFIKNKKKRQIMTSGLRKFHRYPQYFGEAVFWLGISIIASGASLWSFVSFLLVFFLVRFVSGVPQLERHYEDNKKFQEYSKNTPKFFPNFLK